MIHPFGSAQADLDFADDFGLILAATCAIGCAITYALHGGPKRRQLRARRDQAERNGLYRLIAKEEAEAYRRQIG